MPKRWQDARGDSVCASPGLTPPMKLEQLSHLTAIVEHRSLRAAARRLNVPQPALTRSIRSLEKELGVELFLREASGMVLTDAGRKFHVRASAIVHEADRAREELTQQ